jgi:hypothetical protein
MSWKNARSPRTVGWIASIVAACVAALAPAASSAYAQTIERVASLTPPQVPNELRVPAGNRVYFVGHAVGTQNYVCLPSETGFSFALITPQATLSGDNGQQVATHYFSPNPLDGSVRATWEESNDTSTVWGQVIGTSTNSDYVAQGAIAWLLLQPVALQGGTAGGAGLAATTFVQRLNTTGGVAPKTGCALPADVGNEVFVPYTADYFFYERAS